MNRELFKLSVVAAFGRRAEEPFKAAIVKLGIGGASAVVLGIVLGITVRRMQLPQGLPSWWLNVLLFFIAAVVTVLISLLMQSVLNVGRGSNTITKIISITPIPHWEKWLAFIVPQLCITVLLIIFSLPLIVGLASALAINFLVLWPVTFCAIVCGFSFSIFPLVQWRKLLLLFVVTMICAKLLEVSLISARPSSQRGATVLVVLIVSAGLSGFVVSYKKRQGMLSSYAQFSLLKRLVVRYPVFWFAVKLLRNRRTLTSVLICVAVSVTLSVLVTMRNLGHMASTGWIVFGAMLSGALATDVRGISCRYKTPEIVVLRGVGRFVAVQFLATFLLGLSMSLPLLFLAMRSNTESLTSLWLFFVAIQFAAVAVGLFFSTIFVPESGDLGSQFFAAALVVGTLALVPKILRFSHDATMIHLASGWLMIGLIAMMGMYVTESIRRRQYANA